MDMVSKDSARDRGLFKVPTVSKNRNTMVQRHLEADKRSVSQEIPPPYMELEGSLPYSQKPANGP
jgi:hypothetical protein